MGSSIGGIGGNMMSMQELWEQKFNTIDANQDGEINSDELTSALSQSGSGGTGFSASVSEIMDTLDIDGSGTISKAEDQAGMAAVMQTYRPPPPPAAETEETASTDEADSGSASSIFAAADTNEDGYVSLEELTAAMEDVPQGVEGASDAEEIFAQVDTDGDGLISEAEDAEWVARMAQGGPPPPPPASGPIDETETVTASTSATEETSTTSAETEDALYQTLLEVLNDEKQAAALARVFTTAIETYAKNIGSGASGADGTQAASVSAVC